MADNQDRPSAGPTSERAMLRIIGMSRAKAWRAKQVANIPKAEFERLIESDNPPTVTQLVAMARQSPVRSSRLYSLKRAWGAATDDEKAAFIDWVGSEHG